MPDPRFFDDLGPVRLAEIAHWTGAALGQASDGERMVVGVAALTGAGRDSITFLAHPRHAQALRESHAGACFLLPQSVDLVPSGCVAVVTDAPQAAYAETARRLHRPRRAGANAMAADAHLEPDVHLGSGVVVGPGAHIGQGTRIGPNTVVGPGVTIGRDCDIGANVTIGFALIGDRVSICAGVVIGEPGFGATAGPRGLIDIPQLGRVILQDGVTLGANTTVDRGAFEDTVIGENTKIDNLVQIAHNVRIGRNCVLAGHAGLSGSVVVGDNVQFGGQSGVSDHVTIGAGARIAAGAGIIKDIPAGETWGGIPARPIRTWLREVAWLARATGRRGKDA